MKTEFVPRVNQVFTNLFSKFMIESKIFFLNNSSLSFIAGCPAVGSRYYSYSSRSAHKCCPKYIGSYLNFIYLSILSNKSRNLSKHSTLKYSRSYWIDWTPRSIYCCELQFGIIQFVCIRQHLVNGYYLLPMTKISLQITTIYTNIFFSMFYSNISETI